MRKGFTLIELVVVIIIIGILAAIGMTQYTKVVEKGRAAEARAILGTLRSAEVASNLESGLYQTLANLGVSAPDTCVSTHYFSYGCDAATGICTASRCTASGKSPNVAVGDVYSKTLAPDGTWGGTTGY